MSVSTVSRLTATEIELLDPYALMVVLGKRVIHPGGRRSIEELLARADLQSGQQVLDVGCGVGTTAIQIVRRSGAQVTAVDISPLMLDRTCANVHASGLEDSVTVEQGVRPITDHSAQGDSQMGKTLSPTTRRRLDVQGFSDVNDATLAEVAPWLRMAFAMCAVFAGAGTALASPTILWALMPIAALAALFPVHPFDLIYNHGIRYLRNTGLLPKRRAQSRFACGVGAVWLVATAWAFQSGALTVGYILGAGLTGVAVLVSTTDICIPSMTYNALFRRS